MSNVVKDLAAGTAGGIAQVRMKMLTANYLIDSRRVLGPCRTTLRHRESGEISL